MEEFDEVDFLDLDMLGIKRSRALEAYAQLPDAITFRISVESDGPRWSLGGPSELSQLSSRLLNDLMMKALPAVRVREYMHGSPDVKPWNRYANHEETWQRVYSAPMLDGQYVDSGNPVSFSDLSKLQSIKLPCFTLDEYMKNVFREAGNVGYERLKVNAKGFNDQVSRMKQVLILLTGDVKSADTKQFGQRKVDAHKHLWQKISDAMVANPFNLMVVEDAKELGMLVTRAISTRMDGRAEVAICRIAAVRQEFKENGSVKEVTSWTK